ncbi:MAG TPA: DUF2059 domain-containing protein [Flavisolibacter sp.]|nr:DUF2059 domain-containing protein [Flavisolibacter sp.]
MKSFLLATIFLSLSLIGNSQSPSKTKAIKNLLEASGGSNMSKMIFNNIMNSLQVPDTMAYRNIMREVEKEADFDGLIGALIPIYDKYYTEVEINELVAFYNTPVGKKSIEVIPALYKDSFALGQQWGKKLMEKVQKKMQEAGAGVEK